MPTPPKPPEQRRRRNKEQPVRAASTAVPAANVRKAPPPPARLPKRLHAAYREVWRSSVANLWPPERARQVARLVVLEDQFWLGDTSHSLLSSMLQLEREILLTDKASRASGVTMRDEQVVAVESDEQAAEEKPLRRQRSAISRSRRDRILRAVGD